MFFTYTRRYIFIGSLIMLINAPIKPSIVLHGDALDQTISFSNPVKAYAMGSKGQFYVAANSPGAETFAIATVGPYGSKFFPLTPAKVFFNNVETDNPLFSAKINLMTLMSGINPASQMDDYFELVAAVTEADPASIYLIDSILTNRIDMLAIHDLKDATGTATTSGIIQMTSYNNLFIYAAVQGAGENAFGQGNSGIACVARQVKKEENKAAVVGLAQIDAGQTAVAPEVTRAAVLNNDSRFLYIDPTSTGTILNNAVDLNWYQELGSLYMSLNITATSAGNGGAQAIVVGNWIAQAGFHNYFGIKPIAFPSAFVAGTNNIVGAIGDNVTISVHQTRPLLTSTSLKYLALLGGVGASDATKRTVYALPLVERNDGFNGMLAKKTAIPVTLYSKGFPGYFLNRGFVDPAVNQGDLFTADDIKVQVGGGQMLVGDITTILAYNDAVYAVVSDADPGYKPGIYYSQAMFDSYGSIKCWTNWRRVTGNFVDHIFGAGLGQQTGNFIMITGDTADDAHTVKRTDWGVGNENGLAPVTRWLNTIFPEDMGGIQGLYDIPVNMPGVDNISLTIALGKNQVAMVQTGIVTDDIFNPLDSNQLVQNPLVFEQGAVEQTPATVPSNAIAISGGALQEVGILQTVAFIQLGSNTRFNRAGTFFVGGTNGLAFLDNGYGYSWNSGLGNNFSNLIAGTAFKTIGSYRFIRKLIADGSHLYVVADSRLDRIDFDPENLGSFSITTLAQIGTFPLGGRDTILDAVVSKTLALIGTSKGLFRSGLQVDVSIAGNPTDAQWQQVCLPEGLCTARQIFSITQTGLEQDLTTTPGGMVYILDADHGKNRAMVHRFTITPEITGGASQYVVQELPDCFVKSGPSYFAQFPAYRTWMYTDGSLFFQECDRNRCDLPVFALLSEELLSGKRIVANKEAMVPIDLKNANIIQPMIRSSASGSWLLAQNNVLSVNE